MVEGEWNNLYFGVGEKERKKKEKRRVCVCCSVGVGIAGKAFVWRCGTASFAFRGRKSGVSGGR